MKSRMLMIIAFVICQTVKAGDLYRVNAPSTFIKKAPSQRSLTIARVPEGTLVKVIESVKTYDSLNTTYNYFAEWSKVITKGVFEGYIPSERLSKYKYRVDSMEAGICNDKYANNLDSLTKDLNNKVYTLFFNKETISKEEVEIYFDFHPQIMIGRGVREFILEPYVRQNRIRGKEHYPFNKLDIIDSNYYKDAELYIESSKIYLEHLEAWEYPVDLQDMINMVLNLRKFSLWLATARYKYLLSWDSQDLKSNYDRIIPMEICPEVIAIIDTAKLKWDKYNSARSEWHVALYRYYDSHIYNGKLAEEIWTKFMTKLGIRIKIRDYEPGC